MNKKEHIISLTGLRGVLAIWVLLYHIFAAMEISNVDLAQHFNAVFTALMLDGYLAVDAFFILSGFVLTHVYAEKLSTYNFKQTLKYIIARISRIYPVHIFVLLTYGALKLANITFIVEECAPFALFNDTCSRFSASGFLEHLFLIQSWGWYPSATWNTPAWTISSEFAAYLLFPFIIPFIHKVTHGLLSLALALMSILCMLAVLNYTPHVYTHDGIQDFGLIRITGQFIAGCFAYNYYQSKHFLPIHWQTVTLITLLGITSSLYFAHHYIVHICFLFLILSLTQKENIASRFLALRPMKWLGEVSFSLYIVHMLVMETFGLFSNYITGSTNGFSTMSTVELTGSALFLCTLCLGAAALLYYYIEVPFQKRIRSYSDTLFARQSITNGFFNTKSTNADLNPHQGNPQEHLNH